MKKSFSLAVAAWLLVGCQATPPAPGVELTPMQRFVQSTQTTLLRTGLAANDESLVGSLRLELSLDRQGAIRRCVATPYQSPDPQDPGYSEPLARRITAVCWGLILPLLPEEAWEGEGRGEVVAPLIFMPLSGSNLQYIRTRSALLSRDHYLWHSLFADQPIDSVGRAIFRIKPDAQGRTQTCKVTLQAHRHRPDAFRADEPLRRALEAGCARLKPLEMPYLGMQVPASEYSVSVEYAPWKKRLKKP